MNGGPQYNYRWRELVARVLLYKVLVEILLTAGKVGVIFTTTIRLKLGQ